MQINFLFIKKKKIQGQLHILSKNYRYIFIYGS